MGRTSTVFIYISCVMTMLMSRVSVYADQPDSIKQLNKVFLEQLYQERDYFRAISEGYRLKFENENKISPDIDLIILRSHYQMGSDNVVVRYSRELLHENERMVNDPLKYQIGTLLTASLLNLGQTPQAGEAWRSYCQNYAGEGFPQLEMFPDRIDPDKAKLYSAVVPGSGLILSREYGKATVSFLLNAIFLAGIYHYATDNQYGIAAVLSFFELGWYFGGQNAAYEYAERYNQKHLRFMQQTWINNKLTISGMKIE